MKWYIWPKWKLDHKNKWKTTTGFKHRNGRCKTGKTIWNEVPFRESQDDFNFYVGG